MAYLKEAEVRRAARSDSRVVAKALDSAAVLREAIRADSEDATYDVFLCHSIGDAELIQGAKAILEKQQLSVYVDWIVDPQMDRSAVTAETAKKLRSRMKHCRSLLYVYSRNSRRSRWMPWELGYFDGYNGAVAVLPITADDGTIDFSQEEYLEIYPKVELQSAGLFVNRTKTWPVKAQDTANFSSYRRWMASQDKLRL
jgi:hypothetical protein